MSTTNTAGILRELMVVTTTRIFTTIVATFAITTTTGIRIITAGPLHPGVVGNALTVTSVKASTIGTSVILVETTEARPANPPLLSRSPVNLAREAMALPGKAEEGARPLVTPKRSLDRLSR